MPPEISLAAETIGHFGPLRITNALFASWVVTIGIVLFSIWFWVRIQQIPRGTQGLAEVVLEWFLGLVDSVTGSREKSEHLFPLVASFFVFILAVNWFGLLPGVGTIGVYELHDGQPVLVPFFRGGNADLNSTLGLALVSVIATHLYGIKRLGAFRHIGKYFNVHSPIGFFIGILEAIAEFAKVLSFSFRLFGNIFAGEVLLLIVAGLVPYFAPLPFFGLELFVGFVQALVFSTLTLVFLELATAGEGH